MVQSANNGECDLTEESTAGQLSWLLDNLVTKVEHVRQAVLLSQDGLVVATSRSLSRQDGDHMAYEMAMLVRRMGRHLTAPPRFARHEPAAG